MTLGTLVIEAPQRSGALITARLASEYNREVFATPGRAQDPSSFGTNDLIRRGYAKLTVCLEDILDELGEVGEKMRPAEHEEVAADGSSAEGDDRASRDKAMPRRSPSLTEIERRVYDAITYDPIFQDAVLSASQLPPGDVLAAFTALELKGLIKRLPGQLVVRAGAV
jgi:DNA processing protein